MQRGDQVGFTLKDVEGYLRSSSAIEYIRGFAGYVESNDPLSKLTRDSDAEATITTLEELGYLLRLETRDVHLAGSPNLRIAPSSTQMVLYIGKLADEKRGNLPIDSKVTGENVIPAPQQFEAGKIEDELKILAESHPNLKQALLDSIDTISLDDVDFGSRHRRNESRETIVFDQLIAVGRAEAARSTDARIRGTALELVSKIDLSSSKGLNQFYENITRQYNDETDAMQRDILIRTIELANPQFRGLMLEWVREQQVDMSDDTSIEWLLSNEKDIEAMVSLARRYAGELKYSGKDPVLAAAIVTIFRQIAEDPDYPLTDERRAICATAGINLELLPLAFQEAAKDERDDPLFSKIGNLFERGRIEERAVEIARDKEIGEKLAQVAGFIDEPSANLLKQLIKRGDSYPRTTGKTVERFVAELPEIDAARRAAVQENDPPLETLTLIDVGRLLANKMKPGFEALLASDQVASVTVNKKGVTFTMKPGTAPAEWASPTSEGVFVKHKIVPSEDPNVIVLSYDTVRSLSKLKADEYYKSVGTTASAIKDDGSFVVTVEF
jgi:hypothetical protein